MKIAVLPETSMMITNLVRKSKHELLLMTNITPEKARSKDPYEESCIDYDEPPYNMDGTVVLSGNKYVSSEVPSGVRGRLSLADNIIQNAEASIILGRAPRMEKKMYDKLNELILFCGGVSRGNFPKFLAYKIRQKNIPRLEIKYPTNRDEIIELIDRVNYFLENVENYPNDYISNDDNLTIDSVPYINRVSVDEFKDVVKEYNKKN